MLCPPSAPPIACQNQADLIFSFLQFVSVPLAIFALTLTIAWYLWRAWR